MPANRDVDISWVVVLPVKELPVAKSRLAPLDADARADLALAMACDVVGAALQASRVVAVVVVTNDLRAAEATESAGARVVADADDAGLNPALTNAARAAVGWHPRSGVAAISADLPALRAGDLDAALAAGALHARSFVPDWHTTGTALLMAAPGVPLAPAFGAGSRDRHVASGAVELLNAEWLGLRRDVDTPDDLRVVAQLGVGPHTAALLERLRIVG